jgi:hypothetical protein
MPASRGTSGVYLRAQVFVALFLCVSCTPFFDIRAVDVMEVIRGIWKRSNIPKLPKQPPSEDFAALPTQGGVGGKGHWALDFTWNDTVAMVWVDASGGKVVGYPGTVTDGFTSLTHTSGAIEGERGALLGVNATLEKCMAGGEGGGGGGATSSSSPSWVVVPRPGGAASPPPHPHNLTLYGLYAGFLHIPLAPLWGWLGACQTLDCTFSMRNGPPAALKAAVASLPNKAPGGTSALAAQLLAQAAASAGLPAPTFKEASMHLSKGAAVMVGEVASPTTSTSTSSAAAQASAHTATLPHILSTPYNEVMFKLPGMAAQALGLSSALPTLTFSPPTPCTPGSLRLTAVEWSFPVEPFMLYSRLALSDDAWLWAYNRDVSESMGGWDAYLKDLTHSGVGRLHREGCVLQHGEESCGGITGPSSLKKVRSEASWVLLDGLAQRSVSAQDAAAQALGPSGRGGALASPTLPAAASNATFFKLLHWWPGYDFSGAVRGQGAPPLVSFVVAKQAPKNILHWAFGEAWVIALYMIVAGTVVAIQAFAQCCMEARHKKRMEKNRMKHAKARRDRGGSANSLSSGEVVKGGEGGGDIGAGAHTTASTEPKVVPQSPRRRRKE